MANEPGTCATCAYAQGDDKSFLTGQLECHRYPPVGTRRNEFSQVSPQAWCGEFKPKS